ncbi:hypothetical protein RSAG8_00170, partial [Rhizoctonia solani AG-8 WAC10335]
MHIWQSRKSFVWFLGLIGVKRSSSTCHLRYMMGGPCVGTITPVLMGVLIHLSHLRNLYIRCVCTKCYILGTRNKDCGYLVAYTSCRNGSWPCVLHSWWKHPR